MGIIIAVLLFSFIIIFHELGHFLLAKKNGIRVDEFSLGLGPTLLGKQIGETKFSLKLNNGCYSVIMDAEFAHYSWIISVIH